MTDHHIRRLGRALYHLDDLEAEVDAWLEEHPHRIWTTIEPDDASKKDVYCEVFRKPPAHLSLIVGDCIHNLRSALDNLVYELAIAYHDAHRSGPLPSTTAERLMFPIFDTRKEFKRRGEYRIKGFLDPGAQRTIEKLQPYNQEDKGKHAHNDLLWKLNELSVRDKHRLPPVASAVNLISLSFFVPEGIETDEVRPMFTVFEDRAPIASYPAVDKTGAEVDIGFVPVFSVGFSHLVPKELLGRQIPELLRLIHRHITNEVLPPLSPYLRETGE